MDKKGPIILIEEMREDQKLFENTFLELGIKNQILCFNSLSEAEFFIFSKKLKPFLIFSNVLQFHQSISSNYKNHTDLCYQLECPCIFFSLLFSQCYIIDPSSSPNQSYFINPYSERKFKDCLSSVIKYWRKSKTSLQLNRSAQNKLEKTIEFKTFKNKKPSD
ncbi:hypothetical protein [Flavobacterium sp. 3-210]